ncbi:transporter substrate-binding domain-containing protein [Stenotrophomonas sp. G106K1]|uniref:transporter substrate-binding domain-containing protein n=1 Tax=Stenotrophomonas sp. G106K1 TaxID=3134792 RepID=UPI0030F442AA
MTALFKRARRFMLLALFALLPCTSAGDVQHGVWAPGREVRVAAGPTLHPAPEDAADPEVLQTLAHGYAALVARHSGLTFVEVPFPSTLAAMAAVCDGRADLVLVQADGDGARLPCPSLAPSRSFHGGASILAGRIGERLPRRVADVGTLRIAAVEGGPYPAWLAEHHPAATVLPQPSMRAALAAVDAGIADVAIGLESTARAMTRRHFSRSLRLQVLDASFPTQLHLLARHEDQKLLDRIEVALDDITIDEHAQLLQRWAQQALPIAFSQKVREGLDGASLWLFPVATLLLAIPLLAARRLRLQRGLDQKQIQVAGMISHEVRNSAQAVMASIDLLGQAPLPAGQRELVAAAANAG